MMKRKTTLSGLLFVWINWAGCSVWGHSTQVYVSTPFAPPRTWLWLVPVYWVAGVWWIRRVSFLEGLDHKARRVLLLTFVTSIIVSFALGKMAGDLNTVPLPGFGFPYHVFTGYGYSEVGLLFFAGNGLSLAILAVAMGWGVRKAGLIRTRAKTILIAGCLAIYLLCLAPLVAGGAWSHGWHGGYVNMACRWRFPQFARGLRLYMRDHQNRLPVANDFYEMCQAIDAYDLPNIGANNDLRAFCPYELSYEPHPMPYRWNAQLSGLDLKALRQLPADTPVLECDSPHHEGERSIVRIGNLIVPDMESTRDPLGRTRPAS
jgi:hypothetical protein